MKAKIQRFNSADIEILNKKPLYEGFFTMMLYEFRHKKYDGSWSDVVKREMFERGHAVAVLPYDPETEEFVLIEQVRMGAMATSDTPWLIEVIAGIIDEGETQESVCHREAAEEAGIELTHLSKALSYLASPGGTTERLHIYMVRRLPFLIHTGLKQMPRCLRTVALAFRNLVLFRLLISSVVARC